MSDHEIRIISIEEVKPYDKNPRNNAEAVKYVARSIEAYGFKQPIVVDKDNVIIAGHTRWLAAKSIGMKDIPAIIADDLSEEEVKQYRLVDNKVAELATWDFGLLEEELSGIDIDMSEFGFDSADFSNAFQDEIIDDEYDEQEEVEKRSSYGDIFQLGRHRLLCGDSTDKEAVKKLAGGVEMDLFLTDPPYNVDYTGKTKKALKIQNDSKTNDEFQCFLFDAFSSADTVLKSGGVFYIWHSDNYGLFFRGACQDVGWEVRQCLIWNKNSLVLGRQDYQWKHEPCLYGWKGGGAHYWGSDRSQTTVLDFDRPNANREHPTMKPIDLFAYQIKNSSKEGEAVLDLFGGSGTTLIACEQLNRTCYMMELDPHYCDVIIARWEKLTGETAKKL